MKLKTFFRRKLRRSSRVTSCSMRPHADHAGHQQAGGDGRDGHHDRVGEEIEEIQELHPEHRHAGQRAVAQRGQACPAPA